MEYPSLYGICLDELLCSPRLLASILVNSMIPNAVHKDLLVHAALSSRRPSDQVGQAIKELVSRWPVEALVLTDLFPERQLHGLLSGGPTGTFLDQLVEGLLTLAAGCPLTTVDFCGVSVSRIFQLPILLMPKEQRLSPDIMNSIIEQCKTFSEDGDTCNRESVLAWKLLELSRTPISGCYRGHVPLEIRLHLKLSLTEWLAMVDEILGLCTEELSPYRFRITRLSVDNYCTQGSGPLKWFLSRMDSQALSQLYIYGKARSMRLLMWDLHGHLSRLKDLQAFGLGNTGPKVGTQLVGPDEPTDEDVLTRSVAVLASWRNLQVLQLVGLVLTGHLRTWLNALGKPLQKISFYACKLSAGDIESIAACHHLAELREIGLEKNNLRGCSRTICEMIGKSPQLELLNLRETSMEFHEKARIVSSMCGNTKLHTLALYEKEDMLSTSGYEEIVGLACAAEGLKSFYIFPFNYRPFEVFFRQSVEEACSEVKLIKNRLDLQLYY